MVEIKEKDGTVELTSDGLDLKIDSSRYIYVRNNNVHRKYQNIDQQIPYGLSVYEKQQFLFNLYTKVIEKMEQVKSELDVNGGN